MFLCCEMQDGLNANRTLDLASSLEVGSSNWVSGDACPNDCSLRSVLTIAFQFPFEIHLQDTIVALARQYVRSVISSVQRVAMVIAPSRLGPNVGPKLPLGSPEALTLARWICHGYRQVLPCLPYFISCVSFSIQIFLPFKKKKKWHSNFRFLGRVNDQLLGAHLLT